MFTSLSCTYVVNNPTNHPNTSIKTPLYDPTDTTKTQDRTSEAKSETENPGVALPEITGRRAQAERRTLLTMHIEPIGTQPESWIANEEIHKPMKTANAHQEKLRSKHISEKNSQSIDKTYTNRNITLTPSLHAPSQHTDSAIETHTHNVLNTSPSLQGNPTITAAGVRSNHVTQQTLSQAEDRQPHHNPTKQTTGQETGPQKRRENRNGEQQAVGNHTN
jgi:hypothetical protein